MSAFESSTCASSQFCWRMSVSPIEPLNEECYIASIPPELIQYTFTYLGAHIYSAKLVCKCFSQLSVIVRLPFRYRLVRVEKYHSRSPRACLRWFTDTLIEEKRLEQLKQFNAQGYYIPKSALEYLFTHNECMLPHRLSQDRVFSALYGAINSGNVEWFQTLLDILDCSELVQGSVTRLKYIKAIKRAIIHGRIEMFQKLTSLHKPTAKFKFCKVAVRYDQYEMFQYLRGYILVDGQYQQASQLDIYTWGNGISGVAIMSGNRRMMRRILGGEELVDGQYVKKYSDSVPSGNSCDSVPSGNSYVPLSVTDYTKPILSLDDLNWLQTSGYPICSCFCCMLVRYGHLDLLKSIYTGEGEEDTEFIDWREVFCYAIRWNQLSIVKYLHSVLRRPTVTYPVPAPSVEMLQWICENGLINCIDRSFSNSPPEVIEEAFKRGLIQNIDKLLESILHITDIVDCCLRLGANLTIGRVATLMEYHPLSWVLSLPGVKKYLPIDDSQIPRSALNCLDPVEDALVLDWLETIEHVDVDDDSDEYEDYDGD